MDRQKKSDVIKAYLKSVGKDVTELAKEMDLKSRNAFYYQLNNLDNDKNVSSEFISKFNNVLGVDFWSVLNNSTYDSDFILNKSDRISKVSKNVRKSNALIPFYNADFMAGNAEMFYDDNTIYPEYYMDIPEFYGCTAFRAYSDSMENKIKSGAILFGIKLDDWRSHLEYGQIYGITCTDGRRYLKYIRRDKENKDNFLLRSENDHYDDFELPKDKIKNIWLIEGWVNKTS